MWKISQFWFNSQTLNEHKNILVATAGHEVNLGPSCVMVRVLSDGATYRTNQATIL